MKVAVVILNFNGERFLKQFLPGVIASCDPAIAEVVVADNASTDNSVALMRESFPLVSEGACRRNHFDGDYRQQSAPRRRFRSGIKVFLRR